MTGGQIPEDLARLVQELTMALNRHNELLLRGGKPDVIADVVPRMSVNWLYFRVRNVGHSSAFDIRTTVDPPISLHNKKSEELAIFQNPIGVMAPGDEISFFLDSAVTLMNTEGAVLQFVVHLTYRDSKGTEYSNTIPVDINTFRYLSIEMPAIDRIVEKVDRIEKDLDKIARYADQLRTSALVETYRRQVQKPPGETEQEDAENTQGS